uniref:type-2 angiotensin II receptor-like n=1 Tax=Monopterus albus TaxID=43700 RepID=UPI0009B32B64|nr:type-2 angiotensin II receptor-like [Monopterus albus]
MAYPSNGSAAADEAAVVWGAWSNDTRRRPPPPYCSMYGHNILVPLLHGVVTAVGTPINVYMIWVLFRARRCGPSNGSLTSMSSSLTRRGTSLTHYDYFLFHIGLCNLCMLFTIPTWVSQYVFPRGWIFGYVLCKVVKGSMTFSLQYGILTVVYINVERFLKVVYNKTTFSCFGGGCRSAQKRRWTASLLCSCLPTISCLTDVNTYNVVQYQQTAMCLNTADPLMQLTGLWFRTTVCFIVPVAVLALCNGAVIWAVKKHARRISSAGLAPRWPLKGAQIIPLLTVAFFIGCLLLVEFFIGCWIPWVVNAVYFARTRVRCASLMLTVVNVSLAVANMHCLMTPVMYLSVKTGMFKSSLRERLSLCCASICKTENGDASQRRQELSLASICIDENGDASQRRGLSLHPSV